MNCSFELSLSIESESLFILRKQITACGSKCCIPVLLHCLLSCVTSADAVSPFAVRHAGMHVCLSLFVFISFALIRSFRFGHGISESSAWQTHSPVQFSTSSAAYWFRASTSFVQRAPWHLRGYEMVCEYRTRPYHRFVQHVTCRNKQIDINTHTEGQYRITMIKLHLN